MPEPPPGPPPTEEPAPPAPGPRRPAPSRRRRLGALASGAALLVALLGVLAGRLASLSPTGDPQTPSSLPASIAAGAPANAASLAAVTEGGLVNVTTTLPYQADQVAGTGMVLSSSGEVLTNNHVIEGASAISVVDVGNGRDYRATVVGYDRADDVAVLQLTEAEDLSTVKLGRSDVLRVGQGVVTVGNAGGFGGTPPFAAGSITALGQRISAEDQSSGTTEHLRGLIETNAQVISGDSGGALVSTTGRVVGMTTAGAGVLQFQSSQSPGYAIPIDQAAGIAAQIERRQPSGGIHVGATAFLGVDIAEPSSASGAQVVGVVPDSPGAAAGLVAGDLITSVAGHAVGSPDGLTNLLVGQRPGQAVAISYLDPAGQPHSVTATLSDGPPQ